jgi:error-prone DNA polymerase
VHRLLRAIDLNTTLDRVLTAKWFLSQAFLKSPQMMQDSFCDSPDAIRHTQKIADDCTLNLESGGIFLPLIADPTARMHSANCDTRYGKGFAGVMAVSMRSFANGCSAKCGYHEEKGFAPYFLVVADIVRQAPRTCGRGSAAASLVSYCLGITHVDPIRYDLFFERFLNLGRRDPPDIDVDFPWDERDDVLDYIHRKYGPQRTAMIANHNCFKARSAVREIAKVYGLSDNEIGAVTKKMRSFISPAISLISSRYNPIYKASSCTRPGLKFCKWRKRSAVSRAICRCIAAGWSSFRIIWTTMCRFSRRKKILRLNHAEGQPNPAVQVVQWEKDQAEEMGLIKMDILGNRSLAVIRDTLAAVEKNTGIRIDYSTWNPLDDAATCRLLSRGDTIGVFYVESPAMRQLQKKTGKGDFAHLVIPQLDYSAARQ